MNILNRLPDDIQEIIYKINHKDFMKTLKKNLWNNLKEDQQNYYITTKYETRYASYSIYTEQDNLQNPDEVAIKGPCIIWEEQDYYWHSASYNSDVIENVTYGDLLLQTEKVIEITGDKHHIFLEGFDVYDFTTSGVAIIILSLGS